MKLSYREIEEIEQEVDKAFLKLTGRTWREPERRPPLEQAKLDFPSLFEDIPPEGSMRRQDFDKLDPQDKMRLSREKIKLVD